MDVIIFILTLVACGISVAASVLSAWFSRTNRVKTLREDVDEITAAVEKIGRVTRRESMRRVRAAGESMEVPPELIPAGPPSPVADLKTQLRRKMRGLV